MLPRLTMVRKDETLTLISRISHGVVSTLLLRVLYTSPSLSSSSGLLLRPFSSSPSSSSPVSGECVSFFSGTGRANAGDSPVYRRSIQFERPPTLRRRYLPRNSCNFIGSVVIPVQRNTSSNGVYTLLDVKRPPRGSSDHPSSFRILLTMWDKLAEISYGHLKQNDFIYVWGLLCSYEKVKTGGEHEIFHKVIVKDLNYVRRNDQNQTSQNIESLDEKDEPVPYLSGPDHEDHRDRLRLWQVFFANPREWWDNRQGKLGSRKPDFKHKDTHECLSLSPGDPPWVRKQLELYDAQVAGRRQRNPSDWKFEL